MKVVGIATASRFRYPTPSGSVAASMAIIAAEIGEAEFVTGAATTEKNSLTRILRYRKRGTTAWTTARTDAISGLSWAATGHTIGGGTITATDAWEVQVEAADKVASTITKLTVTTAGVAMSWGRVGVGIGKIFEQGNAAGLDLAGGLWWDGVPQSRVSHHATVAARDLAYPTPVVGQLATTGTGAAMQLWKYSGAAGWVELVDATRVAGLPVAMAAGRTQVSTASTSFTYDVSFPAGRFSLPPVVVASCESAAGTLASVAVRAINITNTQFTLYVNNLPTGGATAHYHWIATQN